MSSFGSLQSSRSLQSLQSQATRRNLKLRTLGTLENCKTFVQFFTSIRARANLARLARLEFLTPPMSPRAFVGKGVFDRVQRAKIGGDEGVERTHIFKALDRVHRTAGAIGHKL